MKHSTFSASSAHRWMACPGSIALNAQFPDTTSPAAQEGQHAHNEAEEILNALVKGDDFIVSDKPGVNEYIQTICNDWDREKDVLLVEKRVELAHLDVRLFGTADAILMKPDRVIIYDFKYGENVEVFAENNKQMMYYALMFIKAERAYQNFEAVISQPRLRSGETLKRWSFTNTDLFKFYGELKKSLVMALTTQETVVGDHCIFCRAKSICPAQIRAAKEVLGEVDEKPIVFKDPANLTVDQMSKILDNKKAIKWWLDAVEAHANITAYKGISLPRYKLVKKRTRLGWTKEDEAHIAFSSMADCFKKSLITPTQVIKLHPELQNDVLQLASRKEGEPTLVHESDKRETVEPLNFEIPKLN